MSQPLFHPSYYRGGNQTMPATTTRLKQYFTKLPSGREVSYLKGGSGRTVMVVHGFTANKEVYLPNLRRVADQGHQIIAADLPAHGGTPPLSERQRSVRAYGEIIVELAEAEGVTDAIIIGHSLGARVALEAAVMRPDLFPVFVDLDGIVGDPWDQLMARPFWQSADRLKALWFDGLETVPRHIWLAAQLGKLASGMLWHDLVHARHLLQPGMAIFLASPSAPLLEEYRELGGQTIVIHAEHDYVVPYTVGADAAQRTNGRLFCVKSGVDVAAHAWPMRCKRTFAAWFRGLDLGTLAPIIEIDEYRPPRTRYQVVEVAVGG